MKHKRFEENILVDEAYTNYGKTDKNADEKKTQGIAKHFAETLEYEDNKKWYHQLPEEPVSITKTVTQNQIEEIRKEASSALHRDTMAYETKANRGGSSDHQWAKTLLNKGAIGDRVAAATILIQDNPIYNLTALRNLINNVKPAKKKDGIIIIDALSELLVSELLIPDLKLRTFEQHPLGHLDEMTSGNKQMRRNILKLWYYEDQLKELYGTYVEALNKFAHDSVEANKQKAVSAMSYLLMHHPEREKMLLTNIINKLGDPSQAVASKVIYHLCQLLFNHPNMKSVVLAEIEKMLFRTNISPRAQYYGVCFLNQFFLGKDDSMIAENLIRIYFSFFKASIKKGEIDSRLMSAILTGVKRAYPFANKERLSNTHEHVDAIHRLVHLAKMNIAIHALALLFHISDASTGTSDRYYNALYRKLTNAELFNTTHSALLFSLIYKSLKKDSNAQRCAAFIKRLLQLCCYMTPAQACGMLFLISQVLKDGGKKEALLLTWTKKEIKEEIKDEPQDLEKTEDTITEVANDTLDSTKQEEDEVKVEQKKVDLLKGDKKDLLMDDDEESYVDLKIDEQGNIKPKKKRAQNTVTGWYHARVRGGGGETGGGGDEPVNADKQLASDIQLKKSVNMDRDIVEYNPLARNPAFAGAKHSAYLELTALAKHFHPTVKVFAEKLINNQIIQYSGDPLKDFSGIRFLDRFAFKNPKKRVETQDDDGVKKIKGSHPKFAIRKNYVPKGMKSLAVNSASYVNEDVSKVPFDERFLHDFLRRRREVIKVDDDDDNEDSDNESVNSEDFDRYLDSMSGAKADAASDEELDYLADVKASFSKRGKKQGDDGEALDSDDDDDDEGDNDIPEGSDDEINDMDDGEDGGKGFLNSDDEEAADANGDELMGSDDEEEGLDFDDDDDSAIDIPTTSKKSKGKKPKLKGSDDLSSLFASAEEFSTLLEETATNKKQATSMAVRNTDNASSKQLAWEDKRDHWINGYRQHIQNKRPNNKKGSNPRWSGKNKMADKKGGKRKGGKPDGPAGKKKKFK